jgi:hypothetical protein
MRTSAKQQNHPVEAVCLDRASQDRIGAILRATYERVTKEPIPNQHIDLILALRHKERERRRELYRWSPR